MYRVYLLLLALITLGAAPRAEAQTTRLCFNVPNVTNCIEGRFREYWEQNGGLPVFGYPLTPARQEQAAAGTFLTQYFERNRFELHPDNARPYDVLLGRLGDDELRRQGLQWQNFMAQQQQQGCRWFAERRQTLCDDGAPFKTYWESHGLRDPALSTYQRSLARFGLPLSSPQPETNAAGDTVITQWFERARFEYHPNNPANFRVLLGLLGVEGRDAPPASARHLPADAVWVRSMEQVRAISPSAPSVSLSKGHGLDQVAAAPDGSLIIYYQHTAVGLQGGRLWGLDPHTGQRRALYDVLGAAFGARFSPDSSRLALVTGQALDSWQLVKIDLRAGSSRVIQRGTGQAFLSPIAWTTAGIFVTRVSFGDAPAQDLTLINPRNGATRIVYRGDHWGAVVSADGTRAALTTGTPGLGGTPEMSLSIIATDTGRETRVVSRAKESLGVVAWSPDGTRLAYRSYDGAETFTLHVVDSAGAGRQSLAFSTNAAPGRLMDVQWRDRSTLVLLTGLARESRVYHASLNAFTTAGLRQIGSVPGGLETTALLVYVPRP